MERWLGKFSEILYYIMRIIFGLLFLCHGAQKLFGMLVGKEELSSPMMLFAGIIEFIGGGLIAMGLWAGYAAFLASGEMAVAYFTVHAPQGFFPIQNKGELAVVYCFIFLYIASRGSGKLSIQQVSGRKEQE